MTSAGRGPCAVASCTFVDSVVLWVGSSNDQAGYLIVIIGHTKEFGWL